MVEPKNPLKTSSAYFGPGGWWLEPKSRHKIIGTTPIILRSVLDWGKTLFCFKYINF